MNKNKIEEQPQFIYDEVDTVCDRIKFAGDATYSYLADLAANGPDSDPDRIVAFGAQIQGILDGAANYLQILAETVCPHGEDGNETDPSDD